MSSSEDYNNGYSSGKNSGYQEGYEEGVQAERDRIKQAVDGDNGLPVSKPSETSTLESIIAASVAIIILGWCLSWCSADLQIVFWAGIVFFVIMIILEIIKAVIKYYEDEDPSEKPTDIPKLPQHDEYPPKEKFKAYPIKDSGTPWHEEDLGTPWHEEDLDTP